MLSAASASRRRELLLAALLIAVAAHTGLWLWARASEPSLEAWSAAVAARVHAELRDQETIELEDPPPPEALPPRLPPPPRAGVSPARPAARSTTRRPPVAGTPPPPAEAARVVAQEPSAAAPLDLSAATFVVARAAAYAGGATVATGTNKVAVSTSNVDSSRPPTAKPGSPDRSSAVKLDADEWRCAWPAEAAAEDIDEQSAVIRVVVRPDGTAESAHLIADPGQGFGPAAVDCSLKTRFVPARDRDGNAIRAESPPIRVRFRR
jgi:periplasmic protein TonB